MQYSGAEPARAAQSVCAAVALPTRSSALLAVAVQH